MALSLQVSRMFGSESTASNMNSYVRWLNTVDYPQHLPGKDRQTLRQNVLHSRRTTLFRLHREFFSPDWVVLVWVDVFPFNPLDCSHHCHYLCHNGDLLYLSCRLQLPCGHVSSLCKLGFGSTILLPKHAWRNISVGGKTDVQSYDIRWSFELPWRSRSIAYDCALGSDILWT